jgi:hypothetical protein
MIAVDIGDPSPIPGRMSDSYFDTPQKTQGSPPHHDKPGRRGLDTEDDRTPLEKPNAAQQWARHGSTTPDLTDS